jgi:hypothetical protein
LIGERNCDDSLLERHTRARCGRQDEPSQHVTAPEHGELDTGSGQLEPPLVEAVMTRRHDPTPFDPLEGRLERRRLEAAVRQRE